MIQVAVVGCGVVGAAIAYDLSQVPNLAVQVYEAQGRPAAGATGAALGVMMAAISQKLRGSHVALRLASLRVWQGWLRDLGLDLPGNPRGLLRLTDDPEEAAAWETLIRTRAAQGWPLEQLTPQKTAGRFPGLDLSRCLAALYSSQDFQLDPVPLTEALVAAAGRQGVVFHWNTPVLSLEAHRFQTSQGWQSADWIVVAAGLASPDLLPGITLVPVLGQAVEAQIEGLAGLPVVTYGDVNLVPRPAGRVWVGATVEFPVAPASVPQADSYLWQTLWNRARAVCPALETASVVSHWQGLRPRPVGRPAPIIEAVSGLPHVIGATGHYRNGVLLAPITAQQVRQLILAG
ncbi:MAG: FAD-binding oxidoreductase [Gloeomargaritaceae cyanobacterium C42_A2020_066]|nr:FAD-binding oxidoreductase [Gloeomargaritaceae cyanobacterium C42_A2020_066]